VDEILAAHFAELRESLLAGHLRAIAALGDGPRAPGDDAGVGVADCACAAASAGASSGAASAGDAEGPLLGEPIKGALRPRRSSSLELVEQLEQLDVPRLDAALGSRSCLRFLLAISGVYDPLETLWWLRAAHIFLTGACLAACVAVFGVGGPAYRSFFVRNFLVVGHIWGFTARLHGYTRAQRQRVCRQVLSMLEHARVGAENPAVRYASVAILAVIAAVALSMLGVFLPNAAHSYYVRYGGCEGAAAVMCAYGYVHSALWVVDIFLLIGGMFSSIFLFLLLPYLHIRSLRLSFDHLMQQHPSQRAEGGARGQSVTGDSGAPPANAADVSNAERQLYLAILGDYELAQARLDQTASIIQLPLLSMVAVALVAQASLLSFFMFEDLEEHDMFTVLFNASMAALIVVVLSLLVTGMGLVTREYHAVLLAIRNLPWSNLEMHAAVLHMMRDLDPGYRVLGITVTPAHAARAVLLMCYAVVVVSYRALMQKTAW